jgi:hypothetical protein
MTKELPFGQHTTEVERLAGRDVQVIRTKMPLDFIELDPENPRTGYFADTKKAATGQSQTQAELEFALRYKETESFEKLKQAIEANKGLSTPVWLQPSSSGRYRVVEGNTRLLVYRDLHKKFMNDDTYLAIPAKVLPADVSSEVVEFVRMEAHLRGVNPWDAYERARYLYHRFNDDGMTYDQLSAQTRLTQKEVAASIEAYRTMTERYLTLYKDPNEVQRFSYFAEYHSKKSIRDAISRNGFTIDDLCNWIGTRKLPRAADIRDLPDILDVPESRTEFLKHGYEVAMDVLAYVRPSRADPLFINIGRVIRMLDEVSPTTISELKSGKGGPMLTMLKTLDERLDVVMSLVS